MKKSILILIFIMNLVSLLLHVLSIFSIPCYAEDISHVSESVCLLLNSYEKADLNELRL